VSGDLGNGLPVIVAGAGIMRGHGFIVISANLASTAMAAFMIRHSTGFLQVALPAEHCQRLRIPPLNPFDRTAERMCVGVDVSRGTGTGISAADRAATARALADPSSRPGDFTRPGHVVVVSVDRGDVCAEPTPARLALDLVEHAGVPSAALFAELVGVGDPTRMITQPECTNFAEINGLQLITVD
jgi:3,4-dihydroxy 2-butanone 4-phosphate synthase/GTP cyclohydrolase II